MTRVDQRLLIPHTYMPVNPAATPPNYSQPLVARSVHATHDGVPAPNLRAELPAYAPSTRSSSRSRLRDNPEPKEFDYEVKNRKGKAVAVLTVIAERAYSKHIPTILQDSPLKGRVHLNLDKPESIQSVNISISGEYITGANPDQQLVFLDLTYTLWSQEHGPPRNASGALGNSTPSSSGSNSGSSTSVKFNGKLHGEYTWPFSVALPKEVSVPCGKGKEPQPFALPQTFNERHAKGSINYDIYLRINRGRFQPDHRIPARFGYIPISRPPPFPSLRRLAYQEGTPLLGPTIDPDGWYSDTPVTIRGTVFNNRKVEVICTLCLAKPLCYTRGSLIPFCMRLESDDYQALHLLSTPTAQVVRLMRRIKYYSNPEKILGSYGNDTVDYSPPAVWWPSAEGSEEHLGRFRFLNGELHLKPDMKPSTALAAFAIEYSVVLFPFKTAGFEAVDDGPLLNYPVGITTSFAHGPRPRKYAPPSYEAANARPSREFHIFDHAAMT